MPSRPAVRTLETSNHHSRPVAYGLHWEWCAFGVVPAGIRERIERLRPQFGAPVRLRDEYLRVPGCRINLTIRSGDRPSHNSSAFAAPIRPGGIDRSFLPPDPSIGSSVRQ